MPSKMVLPNWHQNVEPQEKSFSLLDCLKIFMAQISFWGSHYPGLKFQEVNFFLMTGYLWGLHGRRKCCGWFENDKGGKKYLKILLEI